MAKSDKEADEMAAYTAQKISQEKNEGRGTFEHCSTARAILARRLARTAILT